MNERKPLYRSLTALATAALGVAAIATSAQAHDEKYWKRKGPPFVPPGHVYYQAVPVVFAPRPVVVVPRRAANTPPGVIAHEKYRVHTAPGDERPIGPMP